MRLEKDDMFGYTFLRWVHTCNVTAYRNVVTLQVTDSTELRAELSSRASRRNSILRALHTGVPSLYGSPSDVFAASSGFVHLYTLRFKEERTVVTCHVSHPHLLRLEPYHPFDATAKYRQHTEQARNVTA